MAKKYDDEDDDGKKKKRLPEFFIFKGTGPAVELHFVYSFNCSEFFNGVQTIFIISVTGPAGEATIEYLEEEIRNVEYKNFLETLQEGGVIFHNKGV